MDQLSDPTPIESRLVAKANAFRQPISASFELTPQCNLTCDMCYVRMSSQSVSQYGGLGRVDEWLKAAEELKSIGTLFILLTGGEPLLYPGFIELYTSLRKMGFIITINSNGTLITEEIAEFFSRIKPRRINISLYGTSNETYRDLCHIASGYDKCINGLRLLKKYGIDTKINLTLVRKNIKDYPKLIEISREFGFPAFISSYTSLFCSSTCTSQLDIPSLRLPPEEVAAIEIEHLKYKYKDKYSEYIISNNLALQNIESAVPAGFNLSCRAGKSSCWINWRGIMSACVDLAEPSVSLKTNSVSEAWNRIVEECSILPLHKECAGCKLSKICDICYANAQNEKKYCGSVSYLCAIGKAKKELIAKEAARLTAENIL